MKFLFSLILILTTFNMIFSVRHHNSNERYTKITKKIVPNPELCNEKNCPADRGTCSGENFCFCFDGYLSTYESNVLCDYKQKDRTLYFLLEFVLSFGIGHFYAGKYIYGSIKLVCYILFFALFFMKFYKKTGIDAARIRLFMWLNFFIWQFIDGLCIFRGVYKDGNGKATGFKYF